MIRKIDNDISCSVKLKKIDRRKAKKMYMKGENVYIKVADNLWLLINNDKNEAFNYDYGLCYYVVDNDYYETMIVSKYPLLEEYLNRRGVVGQYTNLVTKEDIKGKIVYGNLPLSFIPLCKKYIRVYVVAENGEDVDSITEIEEFENLKVFSQEIEMKVKDIKL